MRTTFYQATNRMKHLLLMILTIDTMTCLGQKLAFKSELVDTIKIKSLISDYQFDRNGTTLGTVDEFTIVYFANHKCYEVYSYNRTVFKGSFKHESYDEKINSIKTYNNNIVSHVTLSDLFIGLTQNEAPSVTYSYIDSTILKQYVNENTFYKIFQSYDTMYVRLFNKSISESLTKAQSIDNFKSYLTIRFKDTSRRQVTDYENYISIYITTGKQNYHFIGEFPQKLKQPWFKISQPDDSKYVLNFNINNSLAKMLPPEFNQLNTITLEALMNDYMLRMMPGYSDE